MIGSWITLSDPAVSEILAGLRFDWLAVDMQHSTMTTADMQNHIRAVENTGCGAYVRVAENTARDIGMALDAGAEGIIVPNIVSETDAKRAVLATHYGGSRGMGLWRSNNYGQTVSTIRPTLILQIEHFLAVENISVIVGVGGVDGFMIGPYDLSASLGKPGDFKDEQFLRHERLIDSFTSYNTKLSGLHIPVPDLIKVIDAKARGYNFIAVGMDTSWMWQNAERLLTGLGVP